MLLFYYLRLDKSFFVSVFIRDYDNAFIKRVFNIHITRPSVLRVKTYNTYTYRRTERPKRDSEAYK